jgi:hypothetical protein
MTWNGRRNGEVIVNLSDKQSGIPFFATSALLPPESTLSDPQEHETPRRLCSGSSGPVQVCPTYVRSRRNAADTDFTKDCQFLASDLEPLPPLAGDLCQIHLESRLHFLAFCLPSFVLTANQHNTGFLKLIILLSFTHSTT